MFIICLTETLLQCGRIFFFLSSFWNFPNNNQIILLRSRRLWNHSGVSGGEECSVASKAALSNEEKEKKAERFWSHIILRAYLIHLEYDLNTCITRTGINRGGISSSRPAAVWCASGSCQKLSAFRQTSWGQRSVERLISRLWKTKPVFNFLTCSLFWPAFRLGAAAHWWHAFQSTLHLNGGTGGVSRFAVAAALSFHRRLSLTVEW